MQGPSDLRICRLKFAILIPSNIRTCLAKIKQALKYKQMVNIEIEIASLDIMSQRTNKNNIPLPQKIVNNCNSQK